jgi:hypothetical protein
MTLAYPTELNLEQYELLYSLLPTAATTGRPRSVNLMLVMQGILYVLVSGCEERLYVGFGIQNQSVKDTATQDRGSYQNRAICS